MKNSSSCFSNLEEVDFPTFTHLTLELRILGSVSMRYHTVKEARGVSGNVKRSL